MSDHMECQLPSDAVAHVQGWLDDNLSSLSKAQVRTLLWEHAEALAEVEELRAERVTAHDAHAERVRQLSAENEKLRSARTFLDGQVFVAGWYAHAESCVSLGGDAREAAWRKYRKEMAETLAEAVPQQSAPTVTELHARCAHPSYEYATTQGPRKSWDGYDDPPEGDGWERNVDAGRDGWERFDYHEESYWRRLRPDTTCDFPSCGHPDHQATWNGAQ